MYCVRVKCFSKKHKYMYFLIYYILHVETLGLSMELNDDILVQTTSLQTIARVKRVKS